MKVLLIYPYPLFDRSPAHEEDIRAVPIGLYYVGALLKENGYDVEILNWFDIHKRPQVIEETLIHLKPDILGFSILNANRLGALEIAQIAKQINPGVATVFGGVAATFLWELLLRNFPQVDYIVTGEGEYAFLDLVGSIRDKDLGRAMSIPGIAFRQKGRVCKNENAPFVTELDTLPIPARYFTYQHVVSSRGCPAQCTFCGSPALWRNRVRFRSPENFVEELEILHEKGIRFFYFSDDTFTVQKKRVIQICQLILEKRLAITWNAISRADCVDEEILYWMRQAGCIQISYGVESGSADIRRVLGKKLDTEQVKTAFALTQGHGILARAYFIYGSPGESWTTIQETIDLIKEIKPLIVISYILEIYPGTKLYEDYTTRLGQTDDVWLNRIEGICYFEIDPNLTREQVLAFGKRIRVETYANLHTFVAALELVDKKDLFPMHADFCSRLGMTFSHGEYAGNEAIKNKAESAEKLFTMALGYAPDLRAYWGLGLLKQQQGLTDEAAKLFRQGLAHFPGSQDLHISLAVTDMNLGRFRDALDHLLLFRDAPEAALYIDACYKALGEVPEVPEKRGALVDVGTR